MPTWTHGKKTFFALADQAAPTVITAGQPTDGAGGGGDDISAWLFEVGWPRSADEVETTTFGAGDYKTYIAGFKDATISLSGRWDAIIDGRLDGILGDEIVAFQYGPVGDDSGLVKYSGNATLLSYDISNSVGDVVGWTASLRMTEAPVRGTF